MKLINTDGMAFIGPGSEWFWRPIRFARGAGGHAPVLEVSRLARDAGIRRLVFAHIGRPTIRAFDGTM